MQDHSFSDNVRIYAAIRDHKSHNEVSIWIWNFPHSDFIEKKTDKRVLTWDRRSSSTLVVLCGLPLSRLWLALPEEVLIFVVLHLQWDLVNMAGHKIANTKSGSA